jgi:hypothetical protein
VFKPVQHALMDFVSLLPDEESFEESDGEDFEQNQCGTGDLPALLLLTCPERLRDLATVKTPILNEDFVGARAGHDHAGEEDAWDVALKGLRIANRKAVGPFKANSEPLEKFEVRMVSR